VLESMIAWSYEPPLIARVSKRSRHTCI